MTANQLKKTILERKLTLIGYNGLHSLETAIINAYNNKLLDGDFVETGAWKGGACLFARALMNELGMTGKVYVCDSFQGLPRPDTEKYPLDDGDGHYLEKDLVISREEVEGYFKEFRLTEGVEFIEGWFSDTLPELAKKIKKISILRLDGDMYQSTMEALTALYDKLSIKGIVIVDDYCMDRCKWAVQDFAKREGVRENLSFVHESCIAIWQKTK